MAEMFFVYILTNAHHNVFYVGVTNDLIRRIYEHKNKLVKGFSYQYNVDKLVYYEAFSSIELAILQEKRMKRWARLIKCMAIQKMNPEWKDLYTVLTEGSDTSAVEIGGRHPGLLKAVPGSPSTHRDTLSQQSSQRAAGDPGTQPSSLRSRSREAVCARDDASLSNNEQASSLENAL